LYQTTKKKTLIEVRVSCCKYLDVVATLRAIEPIGENVRKMHCIWDKSILEYEITASSQRSNPVGYSVVSTREMTSNGMGKSQLTSTGDSTVNIWDQN
jgi:hypothetical protein